jgi:hypothetical protein
MQNTTQKKRNTLCSERKVKNERDMRGMICTNCCRVVDDVVLQVDHSLPEVDLSASSHAIFGTGGREGIKSVLCGHFCIRN